MKSKKWKKIPKSQVPPMAQRGPAYLPVSESQNVSFFFMDIARMLTVQSAVKAAFEEEGQRKTSVHCALGGGGWFPLPRILCPPRSL